MSNVHQLFSPTNLVSHYVRVGHSSYRALENLYSARRIPVGRAVIDANQLERQQDLVHTLYDGGVEIILDTKAAELASNVGMESSARFLPWAESNRTHWITDWAGNNGETRAAQIAEFAVQAGFDTVLSPSHFLQSADSLWLDTDIRMVYLLREALNQAGAKHIRIDYHLSLPVSLLRNHDFIKDISEKLNNAPIGNIWLRVSGYGMSGTPAGTKKYIEAAWKLQEINKPLIADTTGGIAGVSLASFGAVGGICQGIAEKENFRVSNWNKSSNGKSNGGGAKPRVYLPNLDLYLQKEQTEHFLSGRGAKSLALCNDTSCCNGLNEMLDNSRAHSLRQSHKLIERLNSQPELKRVDYLLGDVLSKLGRTLRKAANIKLEDESITKKLKEHSHRTDLLYSTLESLSDESETIPIAKTPMNKIRPMKKAG